jgi:hypothetical protein
MKMEILSLGIFGFCMGLDLVGLRVVRNERSAGWRNGLSFSEIQSASSLGKSVDIRLDWRVAVLFTHTLSSFQRSSGGLVWDQNGCRHTTSLTGIAYRCRGEVKT